jgi:hypothetical protein
MITKLTVLTFSLAMAVAAPALAGGFYVARVPHTTRCIIVTTPPDGKNLFQVGDAHPTADSARTSSSSSVDCTTKRSAGSP